MGLIVFERIMLLGGLRLTGYDFEPTLGDFLYGAPGKFGPWDFMTLALAVLFTAQCFQAYKATRLKRANRTGFLLGACNIVMIGLLSFGLLINWADFNPENPSAAAINKLGNHSLFKAEFNEPDISDERHRTDDWEKLDRFTYRHVGAGIIEREEIIKQDLPIEFQRANYLARNPGRAEYFVDRSIYATHYYDLDGNLLTINASELWPLVRKRLEAAGKTAWDGESEVYERFKRYYEGLPPPKPLTYDEILDLVEASWDGIPLDPEPTTEDTSAPNSSPE